MALLSVPSSAPRSVALYTGLAFVTCSMLLVQQFLTRVFSIQFNSGLAFLAISTTFLGLGAAGVFVYVAPRRFTAERLPRTLSWLAVGYAALLVVGFVVEVAVDQYAQARALAAANAESLTSQCTRVVIGSLLLLPAMFAVGLVISLVLRQNSERVGRLYGADLAGGGVGCLLVLPLMEWIGGDHGIFSIGCLAAIGAMLLAHAHHCSPARLVAAVFAVVMVLLQVVPPEPLVHVKSHRTVMGGAGDFVREDRELEHRWNALSRLGFFETIDGNSIYVRIDSSCQTALPAQGERGHAELVAQTDFQRIPFVLDRHERCLEIGAGGGKGMVLAKALGAREITGVEINKDIVDASLHGFPGFGVGDLVTDPKIRLLVGEGRSYATGTAERFDSVTITFIQTGVASGSAAFALSEANLFTVEAFAEFLECLTPNGLFHVYRHGGVECLRLVSLLREAYARLGVTEIRDRLWIARNEGNQCLVLAGRSPLTRAELDRLDTAARELKLEILYSPGTTAQKPTNPLPQRLAAMRANDTLTMRNIVDAYKTVAHDPAYQSIEGSFVLAADPAAFARDLVVDVSAPDDDRPYFFFTGLRALRDIPLYLDPDGTGILGGTVVMLFWMGLAFTVLVVSLIVVPLLLRRPERRGGFTTGLQVIGYFGGIGIGYIAVQISFIQRFVLFLGHPVHAISVVLLGFLLSSGLGSMCSERLFRSRHVTLPRVAFALALLLLVYDRALPVLFHSSALAWPVPAKVALSLALLFGLAFPMGLFFPRGIRLVERTAPEFVPWAWGANSAASVIGSILALILAIHTGFTVVAIVAAFVYVVTTVPVALAMQRRAAA